jgi:hypothetical protein
VRFATHFGFRPDFCEAADPESKGVVEALCRYVQEDLIVPADVWANETEANEACRRWCVEVNAATHATIAAIPDERLEVERKLLRSLPSLLPPLRRGERRRVDKLATVRIGSARYSVPRELVGRDVVVIAADGEVIIEHDDAIRCPPRPRRAGRGVDHRRALRRPATRARTSGPRRGPARAVRPKTGAERAFVALGPAAEAFVRDAAAAGTTKLGSELALIVALQAAWGRDALIAALERAVAFRRFKAADVRSILEAGAGVAGIVNQGTPLALGLPVAPTRSLDAYRLEELA